MAGPDYILDIKHGLPAATQPEPAGDHKNSLRGRPWLAIHWKCCSVYSRVYRNQAGTAYEGRCPRCVKAVRVAVGEGGTSSRFFEAR